ncbi:DUF7524 family protein [Natronomonas sp. EA1]|uniref:DUF7524 family protein n=1 Tax=Natronomonas sp. EA1 TaxID=3421655 RepID=UPI003EBD1F30
MLVAVVNRTGPRSLEVPASFDTADSFIVELRNEGEPTHVHLRPDDALSRAASLDATNYYLDRGDRRRLTVHVAEGLDERVTGGLRIVIAYGAEERTVEVTVGPETERQVTVDPALSKPKAEPEPSPLERLAERGLIPVVVLFAVGLFFLLLGVFAPAGLGLLFYSIASVAVVLGLGALVVR